MTSRPSRRVSQDGKTRAQQRDATRARIVEAATRTFAERGFRLVFNCGDDAGYSVYHIHLHLLGGRALS